MFDIRPAREDDIPEVVAALGAAFAGDPPFAYMFGGNPTGPAPVVTEFLSVLLAARIALGMPAHVLTRDGARLGLVMGYDTSRPDWPSRFTQRWERLEADVPLFTERIAAYEAICDGFVPPDPHYYLGVIGVHPSLQGEGAGRALLETFCALSAADPRSHGVYLETGNPRSLRFYQRNGFAVRGEGSLAGTPLWCVYRPD